MVLSASLVKKVQKSVTLKFKPKGILDAKFSLQAFNWCPDVPFGLHFNVSNFCTFFTEDTLFILFIINNLFNGQKAIINENETHKNDV